MKSEQLARKSVPFLIESGEKSAILALHKKRCEKQRIIEVIIAQEENEQLRARLESFVRDLHSVLKSNQVCV